MERRLKIRFNMATGMMFVVSAAVASALFVKVYQFIPGVGQTYLKIDAPALFIVSIALTAIGLGALKNHSAVQTMLQITVACLGFLILIELGEMHLKRPLLYWFQGCFGLYVTVPLVVRNIAKRDLPRGPRRTLWKNNCETIFFAFLTMTLVFLGVFLQWAVCMLGGQFIKF